MDMDMGMDMDMDIDIDHAIATASTDRSPAVRSPVHGVHCTITTVSFVSEVPDAAPECHSIVRYSRVVHPVGSVSQISVPQGDREVIRADNYLLCHVLHSSKHSQNLSSLSQFCLFCFHLPPAMLISKASCSRHVFPLFVDDMSPPLHLPPQPPRFLG
jgi:hypothetical protein